MHRGKKIDIAYASETCSLLKPSSEVKKEVAL